MIRKLNMDRRKLLTYAAYSLFGLAALIVCLSLTFPTEAVGQRLAHEARVRTGGRYSLSFESVSAYRLTGFAASNVHVRAERPGKQPLDIRVDEMRARLRVLPLFLLRLSAYFALDLGDGTIESIVTRRSDDTVDASIELDDVNLASPPLLASITGVPLAGVLAGEVDARCRLVGATSQRAPDCSAGEGTISLTWSQARLGPGMVAGITLPTTELGTLQPELTFEKGKAKIVSFKQQGGHFQIKVTGSIGLRPELGNSTLDVCIQLRPESAYLKKNPKMGTALQLAEAKFRKDPQGFLNISLGGTLSSPQTRVGLCRTPTR